MDSVVATEAYKASAVADSLFFATVDATYYKLVMDNKDSYWGPLMMISLFLILPKSRNRGMMPCQKRLNIPAMENGERECGS